MVLAALYESWTSPAAVILAVPLALLGTVGALLAVMIVYLFSAWAIKAVGRTASKIIEEVRRQFRADPEI
jgi:Na+/H+-translocating membrane pyrophosphatase